MTKDAIIVITSVHDYDGEDEDSLEFSTDGHYSIIDGAACVTYLESEVTGLEGTRTSVIINSDQVTVDRDGMVSSRMIFREGEKTSFLYETPVGPATMNISTHKIITDFNEHGGRMELQYVIDMEHTVISRDKFVMTVREQKNIGEFKNV